MSDTGTPMGLASHSEPTVNEDEILKAFDEDGMADPEPYRKGFPFQFDQKMIPAWADEVQRLQTFLRNNGIPDALVDEVAILVPDANAAGVYIFDAVLTDGVDHFNASNDLVHTSPFENDYRVRYDFLGIAGQPFRVEVMHMTDGISPLHAPIYQQVWTHNTPIAVHLSFKCPNEAAYRAVCDILRVDMTMVRAMECSSSYGEFSYWRTDVTDLYVKPRFNRRDA